MWEVLLPGQPRSHRETGTGMGLRAQLWKPFLGKLFFWWQNLNTPQGPQRGALIPVGEEPGSQEQRGEEAAEPGSLWLRSWGGGGWMSPVSQQGGAARAPRGTGSPHLQPWLPCPRERSQGWARRIPEWLGWKGSPAPPGIHPQEQRRGRSLDTHGGHSKDRSRTRGKAGVRAAHH